MCEGCRGTQLNQRIKKFDTISSLIKLLLQPRSEPRQVCLAIEPFSMTYSTFPITPCTWEGLVLRYGIKVNIGTKLRYWSVPWS